MAPIIKLSTAEADMYANILEGYQIDFSEEVFKKRRMRMVNRLGDDSLIKVGVGQYEIGDINGMSVNTQTLEISKRVLDKKDLDFLSGLDSK